MKKIKMILTNRYDPDIRVHKEAEYLSSKGFDVEILCWDRQGEFTDREIEIDGSIRIKRFFPYARYGSGLRQLFSYFKFIRECKKYLKDGKFDYLHCHDLDGALAGLFLKNKNCKFIFDMHEIYEIQGRKRKIRYLIRAIVNYIHNKSDHIIYLNDMQKTFMKRRNINKLVYLPNYPDLSYFTDCEKTQSDDLRVSYIGGVRQYNELKNLMEACRDLPGVRVAIHGSGVAYEALNAIKDNYSNVSVTGRYHFSESEKLYKETDLLYALYPMSNIQNRVGYGIKFFEAIITKTPIIVNKETVLAEFLKEHDIGFTISNNSVEEIRSLILYISKNKHVLDEKKSNIEKIQYNFTWQNIVQNLDEIYNEATDVLYL